MDLTTMAVDDLRRLASGQVILPGSGEYDERRQTFNAMLDKRPAIILQPLDAADVSVAVRWAADVDIAISIRGGGHSVAGHGVGDGSLMLDLVNLDSVAVDAQARIADAGGGAHLEDLDRATTAVGLAAPSGTYLTTGIGGLTLTGGIGYLLGTAGFACDALIGAEIVTADGTIHQVDADTDPELLWALRGGGGNFGVVTRFRYALTSLTSVYGGHIRFAGANVPELVHLLFEQQAVGPDELTLAIELSRDVNTGERAATVLGAWTGDPAEGEAAFGRFRDRRDIVADELREISYLDLQAISGRMGPTYRHYWKGHFVRELSADLESVVAAAQGAMSAHSEILIETIHGAAHRIPESHAAFGARAALANISALAIWEDPADDARQIAWARKSAESLEPFSLRGGGYLNYAQADESAARIEGAFGVERFARLRAVKRRCDPDNRFRFNANIPPA